MGQAAEVVSISRPWRVHALDSLPLAEVQSLALMPGMPGAAADGRGTLGVVRSQPDVVSLVGAAHDDVIPQTRKAGRGTGKGATTWHRRLRRLATYDGGVASKDVERFILNMCVDTVPGFPDGRVDDHESPDFLVETGDRTIGVELQEFIQGAGQDGSPARQGESARATVMRTAQREFESRHADTYLYVYGHGNHMAIWSGRTVRNLAPKVAALVETLVPPLPTPEERFSRREAEYADLEDGGLSDWLTHLTVLRYYRATYGLWATTEAGFSSRDLAALETQIRAKVAKLPSYRKVCDEIWLVLYSLALPSGGFDMEALEGRRLASSFDHVVFLDAVAKAHVLLAG
jgi:hypothetical protein